MILQAYCDNFTVCVIIILEEEKAKKDPKYYLNRANKDTLSILSELEKTYKEPVRQWSFRIFVICHPAFILLFLWSSTLRRLNVDLIILQEKKTAKKTESLTERNAVSSLHSIHNFLGYSGIPISQASKGNKNWFEKSRVQESGVTLQWNKSKGNGEKSGFHCSSVLHFASKWVLVELENLSWSNRMLIATQVKLVTLYERIQIWPCPVLILKPRTEWLVWSKVVHHTVFYNLHRFLIDI